MNDLRVVEKEVCTRWVFVHVYVLGWKREGEKSGIGRSGGGDIWVSRCRLWWR